MKDDYSPRVCIAIPDGTGLQHPPDMPELIHMHEPALEVFTDFCCTQPLIVSPDMMIDVALARMKSAGVRLLLVLDRSGVLVGQITANDILGEVPIRLAQDSELDRSSILVRMVMEPRDDIRVLDWAHLQDCRVGHIVATLHHLEAHHLLVFDNGKIRGMFSIAEISRRLGHDVSELALAAHSLAEMVQSIG